MGRKAKIRAQRKALEKAERQSARALRFAERPHLQSPKDDEVGAREIAEREAAICARCPVRACIHRRREAFTAYQLPAGSSEEEVRQRAQQMADETGYTVISFY